MSTLIPQQGIDLKVPTPVKSANLSIDYKYRFEYSQQYTGWQLVPPKGELNLGLTLPEPQAIRLTIVMCSMIGSEGKTNNPLTLVVNQTYTLFTAFDPHQVTFQTFTFYIPSAWTSRTNLIQLSLDASASTRVTFWSVNVEGIDPQTSEVTSIALDTPTPLPTNIMALTGHSLCHFDSGLCAWQFDSSGWMEFNLVLDQPRLIALTFTACASVGQRGKPFSPFSLYVNDKDVLLYFQPNNLGFQTFQFLVPANWTVGGNNKIQLIVSFHALTPFFVSSFAAAAQVLPAQTAAISFVHENGRLLVSWPAMAYATSYDIELRRGSYVAFSTSGFAGLGMVLPGGAAPGTYSVRVRPLATNVPGAWTDFSIVVLARTIFFLSPAGQQDPTAARLALEDLGIVIFGSADYQHFEGIASTAQITAATSVTYVSIAYGGELTSQQIAQLPANQQAIARAWNYYYSPEYQKVLADERNRGVSWGNPLINAPPVGQRIVPQKLLALLGPAVGEAAAESGERLKGRHYAALEQRLMGLFEDDVASRLCSSMAALPAGIRERLLAPELRARVRALLDADPKVPMRGRHALGIVVVQSSKDTGVRPTGWKVKSEVAAGSLKIELGSGINDPLAGDSYSIGAFTFHVKIWYPASQTMEIDTPAPQVIPVGAALTVVSARRMGPQLSHEDRLALVQRLSDGIQRIQTLAPQFRPANWKMTEDVPALANTFTIAGGQTMPRKGDYFTLEGSSASYQVSAFDTASATIHTSAGIPASRRGTRLTFPDDRNLRFVTHVFDASIDVAYDYNANDEANEGSSYWVLPAVEKVQIGGKSFPPTWAGLESLRLALQAETGAAGAGLIFVSNFPTDWFAFAQPDRGEIVMTRRNRQFKSPYTETVKDQLNSRDQKAVRAWLNAGGLGEGIRIPDYEPVLVSVVEAGRRWHISTHVEDSTGTAYMKKAYTVLAAGAPSPNAFAVFSTDSWGTPVWGDTIEHEIYHLFGAPDEYAGEGTPCSSCGGSYGVFNIPNGNCAACAGITQHKCVMDQTAGQVCDYTTATIGWSDVLVEVTTDPTSQNNDDPMWVKLGDGLMFRLSDHLIDDRRPGARDPYALGYTRLERSDVQMIAVGNGNPAEIKTPWKVKQIRVWVQGEKIYDRDNLNAVVDSQHPFLSAPGFYGDVNGYEITITTGTLWFAGTVDWVYLTLGGKKVAINEYREYITVDDPLISGYMGYPAGSIRTTVIAPNGIDIPNNPNVILTKSIAYIFPEGYFGGDDWYPAHIKIVAHRTTGGDVVVLDKDINTWLDPSNPSWQTKVQNMP